MENTALLKFYNKIVKKTIGYCMVPHNKSLVFFKLSEANPTKVEKFILVLTTGAGVATIILCQLHIVNTLTGNSS